VRLGQGVEWALHCCSLLAVVAPNQAMPATKLAEYHQIPGPYLAKQLQALSAAGLVEAVPGPKGGYRLARPAEQITVLEVVLAVDGGEPAFTCTEIRQNGPGPCDPSMFPAPCGIARIMWDAEAAWRAELQRHTIADLLGLALRDTVPERLEASATWLGGAIR
jgi:Rrf2 family protein